MKPKRVLGIIMAGGKGERLLPLTEVRSKPAVPFGGKYRIIDFVLSNFVNSDITSLYVLVQYRSQSLIEHLRTTWQMVGRLSHSFVSVVPPQMRARDGWYEGTADAVYQNLNLIADWKPDVIAVFGADHVYRMDIRQMLDEHLARDADATVAALPVPVESASGFGILEADEEGRMIGFEEKPSAPKDMPGRRGYALSSMGNYLFKTNALVPLLKRDASRPGTHDFGRNIVPELLEEHRVYVYNLETNEIPGLHPYEERGYWRDVGTLEAYWQSNMDLLGETPLFDLRNPAWPIHSSETEGPMATLVRTRVDDSMIGQGTLCIDADIRKSVIGRDVRIERGAHLEECVIMDNVQIAANARLRRVIADRGSCVPFQARIGYDRGHDARKFHLSDSGLVVLPHPSAAHAELLRRAS
ncbi:MAG TPA: glucose-1-phosphate adenylyltransferase [Nitrospira sp.]|jgi:glucose-1-phosphate adenylyltransferase|nr:glucose-1-phosphate adenylyltransferase [Nitrospira sp.]